MSNLLNCFPISEQMRFQDPGWGLWRHVGSILHPCPDCPLPAHPLTLCSPALPAHQPGELARAFREATILANRNSLPPPAPTSGVSGSEEEGRPPWTVGLTSSHHPGWALSLLPRWTDQRQEGDRLGHVQGTPGRQGPTQASPGTPHASSAEGGAL